MAKNFKVLNLLSLHTFPFFFKIFGQMPCDKKLIFVRKIQMAPSTKNSTMKINGRENFERIDKNNETNNFKEKK